MSERQREFVTSIIKIVFTVMFGGMAAGKVFGFDLIGIHYCVGLGILALLFITGYLLQKEK